MGHDQRQTGDLVKERVVPKKEEPRFFKVLLMNDDYSTMEFVVKVLEEVFQKSPAEAYRVMLQVHTQGSAVAGIYPWEVAETKVETVTKMSKSAGYPLRAVTEEA